MKLRLPVFIAVTLAVMSGVTGCAKRETIVEIGTRKQILHLGNLGEPNDIDPQTCAIQETAYICMALFEGLCQYDARTNEPVPAAAERWEVAPDNLTWTFHLRPTARWSNGDPVTARDFVFAYQRMLSPRFGAEYAYLLYALKNGEAYNTGKVTDFTSVGVKALNDYTLQLSLAHPAPYLPAMLCSTAWFPVHPPTILKFGQIDERGTLWTRPGNLVGNGYFTLAEWKSQQYIHCTKSPTYWDRENVKLNDVYFYAIESPDVEERAFRAGQLHVTRTIPPSKIIAYQRDAPQQLHEETILSTYLYLFNVNRPPLNDARVRRALAMAIDREQLVKNVTQAGQLPANNFTPPDCAGFTARARIPTDIPAAQKLLAEAGFPGGAGFPKLTLTFNTNDTHRLIAEAIQQMWRKNLGVDIAIANQEGKVWGDNLRQHNFQIVRFSWGGDYLDPSTFFDIMASDSGNNNTGWKNGEYDDLLNVARQTANRSDRYQAYQRCEEILAAEAPFAPIYFYTNAHLRHTEVRGWYDNLLDMHPLKGVYLEK